jgi:hypothetical protein
LDRLARLFKLKQVDGLSVTYRTHWFILLKKIFLPSLLVLCCVILSILYLANSITFLTPVIFFFLDVFLLIIGFAWAYYEYYDWRDDVYVVTMDQIIDIYRKPLSTELRRAAPIRNIQSLQYKRNGIIGLLLNFGTVKILVGNEDFTFDLVYTPADVQQLIFERFLDFSENARSFEQRRMADWLVAYDQFRQKQERDDDHTEQHPN